MDQEKPRKVCSSINLKLYLNIPETPNLQASALNRFIRGKGHSSCKQRKQHIEFLFIFCLLKKSNMAIKDIKYQYSTTGSRSWTCGCSISSVTMCNKNRYRGTSRFPLFSFNQGYNTFVLNNGGILWTICKEKAKQFSCSWTLEYGHFIYFCFVKLKESYKCKVSHWYFVTVSSSIPRIVSPWFPLWGHLPALARGRNPRLGWATIVLLSIFVIINFIFSLIKFHFERSCISSGSDFLWFYLMDGFLMALALVLRA